MSTNEPEMPGLAPQQKSQSASSAENNPLEDLIQLVKSGNQNNAFLRKLTGKDFSAVIKTGKHEALFNALVKCIKQSNDGRFNFFQCTLSEDLIAAICEGLSDNTNIEYLQLENVGLTSNGLQHIINLLKRNQHISYLNISSNKAVFTEKTRLDNFIATLDDSSCSVTKISAHHCDLSLDQESRFLYLRGSQCKLVHEDLIVGKYANMAAEEAFFSPNKGAKQLASTKKSTQNPAQSHRKT